MELIDWHGIGETRNRRLKWVAVIAEQALMVSRRNTFNIDHL